MHGVMINGVCTQSMSRKLKGRHYLEYVGVPGRKNIKTVLKESWHDIVN
jgi:hypothetical protein